MSGTAEVIQDEDPKTVEEPKPVEETVICLLISFTYKGIGGRKAVVKEAWEKIKDLPDVTVIDAKELGKKVVEPPKRVIDPKTGLPVNVWGVPVPHKKEETNGEPA